VFPRLPGIAGCCVRVRVKLGSEVWVLRVPEDNVFRIVYFTRRIPQKSYFCMTCSCSDCGGEGCLLQALMDSRVFRASSTCFSTPICEEKTCLTTPSLSMT
jgi:hypothetical protein